MPNILSDPIFWQAAAVFVAAAAAIGAWLAARATTQSARAAVVASLIDSYIDPRMMDGMHAITVFRKQQERQGKDWVETFRRLRRDDYDEVRDVDHGRRRFSGYFYTVFHLRRRWRGWPPGWEGMLTDDLIDAVASDTAMRFLLKHVEPIDQAIAGGGYTADTLTTSATA